ncbi:MAG: dihydroorotase [Bacillota bacterium]|nr:dihydroorotase [Bacillota bacterium]
MRFLLRGGIVVDPVKGTLRASDVLVADGCIAAVGPNLSFEDGQVFDISGHLVSPGLIDMHVHLREPGYEYKEDIASGTAAAVRGGFTSVACMPNTDPVADSASVITFIKERAAAAGLARVYPVAAVTAGSKGEQLAPMAETAAAGAVAFSDDGRPVSDGHLMRRAMEYAARLGRPIISHCEDPALAAGGVMHEGPLATALGLRGIPGAAEEVMVARDLILAQLTGCALHVAHVSSAGTVRLIREAKARGVRVTAEATPHHFTLTDEAVRGYDTNAKVNPPLRGPEDVAAVREGLADGTIDVIATDHAPHADHEKDVEFDRAPFGIIGLETAVGLVFSELIASGILDIPAAVAKMTVNPARILGIKPPAMAPGARADLTVIDPHRTEVVCAEALRSKSRNTPFLGYTLKGLPVMTVVGGKVVMRDGDLI